MHAIGRRQTLDVEGTPQRWQGMGSKAAAHLQRKPDRVVQGWQCIKHHGKTCRGADREWGKCLRRIVDCSEKVVLGVALGGAEALLPAREMKVSTDCSVERLGGSMRVSIWHYLYALLCFCAARLVHENPITVHEETCVNHDMCTFHKRSTLPSLTYCYLCKPRPQ